MRFFDSWNRTTEGHSLPPASGGTNFLYRKFGGVLARFLQYTPSNPPKQRILSPASGGQVGNAAMVALGWGLLAASPAMAADAWQTPAAAPAMQVVPAMDAGGNAYFNITAQDVAKEVANQLQLQAVETKAEASLSAGSPAILYSANHPLKLVIQALQVDTQARRWQAQANILAGGKTETVKPISGTYIALVEVPVLTRQLGRTDVIEATDITLRSFPDRLIRKDTVTDSKMLLGQSPRAVISINRPIRQAEVSSPILIKKGSPVQLTYSSQYMSIKTSGIALQDGALGEMIRVKNEKSEKAVSGRVAAAGRVEVNTTPAL